MRLWLLLGMLAACGGTEQDDQVTPASITDAGTGAATPGPSATSPQQRRSHFLYKGTESPAP